MVEKESAAHDVLSQAEDALDAARRLMNKTLQALHDRTVRDGRVSPDAMDSFQSVCYDIALSASEQTAARTVVDYARQRS